MSKLKNIKHRDGFTFFKSYDDVMQNLNDKQFLQLMRTILDVQFLRVKYEKVKFNDNILDLLWSSMKYNISSQVDGYLANFSKNNSQFMGVYKEYNDPLDGGGNDPLPEVQVQVQGKEEVQEEEKEQNILNLPVNELTDKDFTLSKLTSYDNLSATYKEKLEEFLNRYIEDLELKILNANGNKKTLQYEDFILSLEAKGYKYKNFISAYKTWNRGMK